MISVSCFYVWRLDSWRTLGDMTTVYGGHLGQKCDRDGVWSLETATGKTAMSLLVNRASDLSRAALECPP